MSEKRRPDAVITLKSGDLNRKYELYKGAQFSDRAAVSTFYHAEQPNLLLTPLDIERGSFVRVRCDGAWVPKGRRAMFPLARVAFLISQDLQQQLREEQD